MATVTKPIPLSVLIENIPAELKALHQWVLWRYVFKPDDKEWTKVPYQVTGKPAKSNDPDTWNSFDGVTARLLLDGYDGIGIMQADGLAGFDLDHQITGGVISEFARDIITRMDTYAEISPSGEGIRIFFYGTLPESGRKKAEKNFECYSSGRFLTVTGHRIEETPLIVNQRTAEAAVIHREIFGEQKKPQSQKQTQPNNLDDQALLKKAQEAKNGAKFSRLFAGNWSMDFESQSEADLALCSHLAFWTGGDRARIDRLFRDSGLYREKWNENHNGNGKTYGDMTIDKSLEGTDFYNPTPHEQPSAEDAQPTGQPDDFLLTAPADHDGHAQCVMHLFPDRFMYVEAYGWLYNNGKYWQREGAEAELGKAVIHTLRARRAAAAAAEKYDLVKACHGSEGNVNGTRGRLKDRVTELIDCLDNNPDLLNVQNGVLNLRTGELMPHSMAYKFTYVLPIEYDPKADRSEWLAFLQSAVGDYQTIEFLQMATGYSLTGNTWEEIMFYIFGPTRSGKGTFTETIIAAMGTPLSTEVDFVTFTADRTGDTQNFDLAPLKPCRFVAASESNKNQPLNPAKIKALTGRNYVRCAFKHRDHFQYQPSFKIWLSSNNPVNVDVDDDAAWGRVRVIQFPHSHLGEEDISLKQRLTQPAALRGVLAWMVEGARVWYEMLKTGQGMPVPQSVTDATQQQRDEQDQIKAFIEERCTKAEYTKYSELYQAYKSWCEDNGVSPKLQKQFSQSLKRKGYPTTQKKVNGKNDRYAMGLGLLLG